MKKPFKKSKFGRVLIGLSKVAIAGAVDFIPGGETIARLVKKTPEDEDNTNGEDVGRIIVVIVLGITIIGVLLGKLTSEQLDGIINSLSE